MRTGLPPDDQRSSVAQRDVLSSVLVVAAALFGVGVLFSVTRSVFVTVIAAGLAAILGTCALTRPRPY